MSYMDPCSNPPIRKYKIVVIAECLNFKENHNLLTDDGTIVRSSLNVESDETVPSFATRSLGPETFEKR